ncbi:hypothetical protein BDV33DRAFT_85295 [Aspergillus novoparasiticus]|uniref:Uncharacterized protein n=1 Tax=Aspergillus novoparasiticus TaxID=986946 RepID=A0A5N6EUF7_9EURO|nr:hypothetical protein BDV33DRAFT_85295 [Aspergillus novoparasiticus]
MSDRKQIRYTYECIEAYEENDEKVRAIITEDTGSDNWICTRSLPPICYPPPLTTGAIQKLKDLQGVAVSEIDEE